MTEKKPSSDFIRGLCSRIQLLRSARGFTQSQMAAAMGITLAAFKKYEQNTPMPAHLLERFSLIVGRDIDYLITGKSVRWLDLESPFSSPFGGKN